MAPETLAAASHRFLFAFVLGEGKPPARPVGPVGTLKP